MSLSSTVLRSCPCTRQLILTAPTTARRHAFSTTSTRRAEAQPEDATADVQTSTSQLTKPRRPIPPPLPFVPDVKTFLTLIGRNSATHLSKIPSWDALFSMSPLQLRSAGIEPPRARKYICWWRERFRQGVYGIGGDFQHVSDGKGYVQVVEVDSKGKRLPRVQERLPAALRTPGKRAVVVNLPEDQVTLSASAAAAPEEVRTVAHVGWLPQYKRLRGSNLVALKGHDGRRAVLEVKDGLWEQKRGTKVDGGERRRAEVRAKRRAKENKEARAAAQQKA